MEDTTPYWVPNINGNSKTKTWNLSQQLLGHSSPLGSGTPLLQPLDYQDHVSQMGFWPLCFVASPLLCRCSYSEDSFLVPAVWLLCMRSKPPLHEPRGNIWSTDCEAPESEMFISPVGEEKLPYTWLDSVAGANNEIDRQIDRIKTYKFIYCLIPWIV